MNKRNASMLTLLAASLTLVGTALAGGGHHNRMDRLDANEDGKVTLPELTEAKQTWFNEVDADKNGVATQAELDAHVKAKREKHVQELFQRKDANRDGRLTREESGMPERWFARGDQNGDGAITAAELAQRKERAGHGRGRGGRLKHLDQNGDGKVERSEVAKSAEVMFERLDRNSDGALTRDELQARGKRGPKGHGAGRGGPPQGGKAPAPGASAPAR